MNIHLYLTSKIEEYGPQNLGRYEDLYETIQPPELRLLFSKIHFELDGLFSFLNERNPSRGGNGHYLADSSRALLKWIEEISELESSLRHTPISFTIDDSYKDAFILCRAFLTKSGGSEIPSDFPFIEIKKFDPIFFKTNSMEIHRDNERIYQDLSAIGSGAYATTYKFYDPFYDHWFAVKRANADLNAKEYERFKLEFKTMKELRSPYIVEVYSFNDARHEYIMELLDSNLYNYLMRMKNILTPDDRRKLATQILRAFEYLESKQLFHRDVSYSNILIKEYEHVPVVKISDFGLVKVPGSQLSSEGTAFKGTLNDPRLIQDGFKNYTHCHEVYALTRAIYFVLSGQTDMTNIADQKLKAFVGKGINANSSARYQTISEMRIALSKL